MKDECCNPYCVNYDLGMCAYITALTRDWNYDTENCDAMQRYIADHCPTEEQFKNGGE